VRAPRRPFAFRLFGWLALAVAGVACNTPRPFYDYASEPDPRKQPFVLGTSDVLRVNVRNNPDLTGDAVVRPDGNISLVLIGEVQAAGRQPEQVREEIVQRRYRFVVAGNAERPGAFTANHYVTVSEAIALAGGPNRFSSPEDTVIIRIDPVKGRKRIPVDYLAILKGTHPEHDLPLISGDTVYVP
jgi:polysaccharide export outer membrane protein